MTWPGCGRNEFVAPGCYMSGEAIDMLESVSVLIDTEGENPKLSGRETGFRARFWRGARRNGVTFQIWKVADLAGFRRISCISASLLVLQVAAGTCVVLVAIGVDA